MIKYDAGLVDGEGSFIISFSRRQRSPVGFLVAPSISMALFNAGRVLAEFKRRFGGEIHPIHKQESHLGKLPMDEWTLCGRDICKNFAESIAPHLIIKRGDCQIFLKILKLMSEGEHYTKEGILKIARLRKGLNKYRQSRVWTLEKIERELENIGGDHTSYHLWTNQEIKTLKENWNMNVTDYKLAKLLPRHTPGSIRRKRMSLGLKKRVLKRRLKK